MEKVRIEIDMTEEDLHDLMNGEEFTWHYPSDDGKVEVEVNLYNSDINPREDDDE